jgi:ElaB/YqjD/DUF883 family membrane-anchored ribosome-binding protein
MGRPFMNKPHELNQLTSAVEDLLCRIADVKAPDVAALRARVSQTIETTKGALKSVGATASNKVRNTASSADDYVRDNPWTAAAALAGIAAVAGFIVGRATGPK